MLSVFTYQVLRLLRDRILLAWVVAFPVILSCLFMAMFSNLDETYQATPLSLGVVQDDAYRAATGLDATVRTVSQEGDRHLLNPTPYATADQAQEAARKGDTVGYIDVEYESAAGSLMDVRTTSYLEQVRTYMGAVTDDPARAVALADAAMEHTAAAELVPQESTPLPHSLLVFAQFSLYPLTAFAIVSVSTLMASLGRRAVRSRLSAAPVSGWERGRGLLGSCLVVGLVGWAWILCLGVAVFGRGYLVSAAPLLGVVGAALGAYTLVPVSLGFLLGQLGLGENAANVIANIGGLALSFLGGAWISADIMPAALVAIARFTPTYWANRAMTGASDVTAVSADTVLPLLADCGVCALFAVALLSVGLAVGRTRARSAL